MDIRIAGNWGTDIGLCTWDSEYHGLFQGEYSNIIWQNASRAEPCCVPKARRVLVIIIFVIFRHGYNAIIYMSQVYRYILTLFPAIMFDYIAFSIKEINSRKTRHALPVYAWILFLLSEANSQHYDMGTELKIILWFPFDWACTL